MYCIFCEKTFTSKYNLNRHINLSLNCKKLKNLKEENELLKNKISVLENKILLLTSNKKEINILLVNIKDSDIDSKVDNFDSKYLLEYGGGLSLFLLKETNILNKIKIKDKFRKKIIYKIYDKLYIDNGEELIYFLLKKLKNKIINLLEKLYNEIEKNKEKDICYNSHTQRMINIKNIELNEILENKNTDIFYFKEFANNIILYLNDIRDNRIN